MSAEEVVASTLGLPLTAPPALQGAAPAEGEAPKPAQKKKEKTPKPKGEGKGKGKGKGKTPWRPFNGPMSSGQGFRLNVKNLSSEISTAEQLKTLFGTFGTVVDAEIKAREDGSSRGFGFVIMATEAHGQAAMSAMNGKDVGGKALKVLPAERREDIDDVGVAGSVPSAALAADPNAAILQAYMAQMQMQQAALMQAAFLNPAALLGGLPPPLPGAEGLPGLGGLPGMPPVPGMSLAGMPPGPGILDTGGAAGNYEGSIKSISAKNGYGFITCAETFALHKRDVYVDKELLPEGAKPGDRVFFTCNVNNKGQPRATTVQRI